MKIHETGHIYELASKIMFDGHSPQNQTLTFVNQQPSQEHEGTTTQEVLRALIDRTRHCANCMPHPVNERIIHHLRMALVLHEARALERRAEKGELRPEYLPTVDCSHLQFGEEQVPDRATEELIEWHHDWDRKPNHPISSEFAIKRTTPMALTEATMQALNPPKSAKAA